MYETIYTADIVIKMGKRKSNLFSINAENGFIKWILPTDSCVDKIFTDNHTIYVTNCADIYSIDAKTGVEKWSSSVKDISGLCLGTKGIVKSNDILYISNLEMGIYALNATTGEVLWEYSPGWVITSTPVIFNGSVYFGAHDCIFYILDAINGEEKGIFKLREGVNPYECRITESPVIYNDTVFFGSYAGGLHALSLKDI